MLLFIALMHSSWDIYLTTTRDMLLILVHRFINISAFIKTKFLIYFQTMITCTVYHKNIFSIEVPDLNFIKKKTTTVLVTKSFETRIWLGS